MAITLNDSAIQATSNTAAPQVTVAVTASDTLIVVCVGNKLAETCTAPSDDQSNTYAEGRNASGNGPGSSIWYCKHNGTVNASNTITVNTTSGDHVVAAYVFSGTEVTGSVVGVTAGANANSNAMSVGITTGTDNSVIIFAGAESKGNTLSSPGTGQTNFLTTGLSGGDATDLGTTTEFTTTAGSNTQTLTISKAASWNCVAVEFLEEQAAFVGARITAADAAITYTEKTGRITATDAALTYDEKVARVTAADAALNYDEVGARISAADAAITYDAKVARVSATDASISYNEKVVRVSAADAVITYTEDVPTVRVSAADALLAYDEKVVRVTATDAALTYVEKVIRITATDSVLTYGEVTARVTAVDAAITYTETGGQSESDDFTSGTWPKTNWADQVGWASVANQINDTDDTLETASANSDTLSRRTDTWSDTDQSCTITWAGGSWTTGQVVPYAAAVIYSATDGSCWIATMGGDSSPFMGIMLMDITSGGTFTQRGSAHTLTAIDDGDKVRITYDGTDMRVDYYNGTSWTNNVIVFTRGSIGNSSGTPGVQLYGRTSNPSAISYWEASAGSVPASARITAVDAAITYTLTTQTAHISAVDATLVYFETTVYPASTSGRQILDGYGTPMFFSGATPWHIFHRLSNTDRSTYLADREARGVNAIIASAMVVGSTAYGNASYNNVNGDPAFTDPDDWSTIDTAYWDHVAAGVQDCLDRGITVFMSAAYIGYTGTTEGWECTNDHMSSQSDAAMTTFGTWLGNRFRDYPNIVWMHASDADPDTEGVATRVNALQAALEIATSPHHLHTVHGTRNATGRDVFDQSWMDLDTSYGDIANSATYNKNAYDDTPTLPYVYIEGRYEDGSGATDVGLRSQMYWAMFGGACGQFYGHEEVWNFGTHGIWTGPWTSYYQDPGADWLEESVAFARADYVPDWTNSILTAGYGTIGTATFAMCAKTSDSTRIMAYSPGDGQLTFTLTSLSEDHALVKWIDPTDGSETVEGIYATTTGMNFTPPAGDDWLFSAEAVVVGRISAVDATITYSTAVQTVRISAADAAIAYDEIAARVTAVDATLNYDEKLTRVTATDATLTYEEIASRISAVDATLNYEEVTARISAADASIAYDEKIGRVTAVDSTINYEVKTVRISASDAVITYAVTESTVLISAVDATITYTAVIQTVRVSAADASITFSEKVARITAADAVISYVGSTARITAADAVVTYSATYTARIVAVDIDMVFFDAPPTARIVALDIEVDYIETRITAIDASISYDEKVARVSAADATVTYTTDVPTVSITAIDALVTYTTIIQTARITAADALLDYEVKTARISAADAVITYVLDIPTALITAIDSTVTYEVKVVRISASDAAISYEETVVRVTAIDSTLNYEESVVRVTAVDALIDYTRTGFWCRITAIDAMIQIILTPSGFQLGGRSRRSPMNILGRGHARPFRLTNYIAAVRVVSVDATITYSIVSSRITSADATVTYSEAFALPTSAMITGRVRMLDCRSSDYCGQDTVGGEINPTSIKTTSGEKDDLAAMGFAFFPESRAFTLTGQSAIDELVTRNSDFRWMLYTQFGHCPATLPAGDARPLDTDFYNLLWSNRALDTSAQPVVAYRKAGVPTAYWANYCFPNTEGEIFNKTLIDQQLALIWAAIDGATHKPFGVKFDYFNVPANGYYAYDLVDIDLDQDGTAYTADAEEIASYTAAQLYWVDQWRTKYGDDFVLTGNGQGSYSSLYADMAAKLNGWYCEGFPTGTWASVNDDPLEFFDILWGVRQAPSVYKEWGTRIATSNMPFFHTDVRTEALPYADHDIDSDRSYLSRIAAMMFDGWYRHRPIDPLGTDRTWINDANWDAMAAAAGDPTGAVTRTPAGDFVQYSRSFTGGIYSIVLNSTLSGMAQVITFSGPGI